MASFVSETRRKVEKSGSPAIEQYFEAPRIYSRHFGGLEFGNHRFRCTFHKLPASEAAVENMDLGPAHLRQPRPGHHRAHAIVVDQHDAGVARRHVNIGRLDQLPARRRARPGEMAARVFLGAAHIEQIERAVLGLGCEPGERGIVDMADRKALGHPISHCPGTTQTLR